jgi:GR25 family glycosyltransferase involved in LPS biosynthesis
MKVQITYVDNPESIDQANQSLKTFLDNGWDAEIVEGITPQTLNEDDFPYADTTDGRLASFRTNEPHKYPIKKSCLFNNLKFCERVLDANEPMVFAEQDAICIAPPQRWYFEDYLCLTFEYAFQPPTALAKPPFNQWHHMSLNGVQQFPRNYPLKYYKQSVYNGYIMAPGTAAYGLTPRGARKLLDAAEEYGLEQSDFFINAKNLMMQYTYPSPVKYNRINLNLSHKG